MEVKVRHESKGLRFQNTILCSGRLPVPDVSGKKPRTKTRPGWFIGSPRSILLITWLVPLALGAFFSFVLLGADGHPGPLLNGTLRTSQDVPGPVVLDPGGARVAILIEGLGDDIEPVGRLLSIGIPLTLGVLPYRRHSHEVAERAYRGGIEVLLQVPLEPRGFPLTNPGPGCLLVSMGRQAIQLELAAQVASLPYCSGVSPHMGSLFFEEEEPITFLMAFLKERDLFWVDSRGSPVSRVTQAARAHGVPFVQVTHLLDEQRDEIWVIRQLCRLADFAARNGWALGIGRPYPETLAALPRVQAAFREKNVTLVPVSGLIPPPVENLNGVQAALGFP